VTSKNNVIASAEVDVFASQFDKKFSLIACMESLEGSIMWHIDDGDSFHITTNTKYFKQLKEKDMQFQIELVHDGKYASKGVGTINFKREFGSPLHLRDVGYALRLKRNLFSVATLEDKGYDVIFSKGKAYPRLLAS